jgi:hypothetical protein
MTKKLLSMNMILKKSLTISDHALVECRNDQRLSLIIDFLFFKDCYPLHIHTQLFSNLIPIFVKTFKKAIVTLIAYTFNQLYTDSEACNLIYARLRKFTVRSPQTGKIREMCTVKSLNLKTGNMCKFTRVDVLFCNKGHDMDAYTWPDFI